MFTVNDIDETCSNLPLNVQMTNETHCLVPWTMCAIHLCDFNISVQYY